MALSLATSCLYTVNPWLSEFSALMLTDVQTLQTLLPETARASPILPMQSGLERAEAEWANLALQLLSFLSLAVSVRLGAGRSHRRQLLATSTVAVAAMAVLGGTRAGTAAVRRPHSLPGFS